ncbi:MAG: tRNA (adenosine(37)-N6)-dimethylallyltransferase MiaA, partial [Spirochaetia bacterium]|nr:tRNA (adenosine(37)-N6)-dimethylallyltransferase MiaA [Spirochaetia bacterium]
IRDDIAERGTEPLYDELLVIDPSFAGKIHPNDRQRIMRGLEVYRGPGRPLSWYYREKNGHESDETLYIGLYDERESLNDRINERVDAMIASGFADEVKNLREMGYTPELKSMKSIGYAELNRFLDGLMDFKDAVDAIKKETRHYAKRQMTWFRRNKKINWFKPDKKDALYQYVFKWLNK